MIVEWTPFALAQLNDILETIKENQSLDVALKWQGKIDDSVAKLEDFPFIGPSLPPFTYQDFGDFFKGLRQLIVKPYRIVYEVKDDRCEILFCQRASQMLTPHEQ